jgi:hypothetical protein
MANTTNLNLVKPAGTDYALVSVINSNMDIIDSKVGAIPANESAQSQITALNNQIATMANVQKESIARNGSKSLTITKPCLVIVGRSSVSTSVTMAFIDGWAGIIYVNQNANFTLSISGDTLTISNNSSSYCSYEVLY